MGAGDGGWRALLTVAGLGNLGDGVRAVGFPLIATALTDDPILIAATFAAGRLPWLLGGLIGGVVIDRSDLRAVLVGALSLRTVILGLLFTAGVGGRASMPLLLATAVIVGSAETFADTAASTAVPRLVDGKELTRANGRLQVLFETGQLGGPLLGAFAFTLSPFAPALLEATLTGAAAAVALRMQRMVTLSVTESGGSRWIHEIRLGVAALARHRLLRRLTGASASVNLAAGLTESVLVVYASQRLGAPAAVGTLAAACAGGAVFGGFTVARVGSRVSPSVVLPLALATLSGCLLVLTFTSSLPLALFVQVVIGLAAVHWSVTVTSERMRLTSRELLGRMTGLHNLAVGGTAAAGALASGVLIEMGGEGAPFLVGAVLAALTAIHLLRRRTESPDAGWSRSIKADSRDRMPRSA